MPLLSHFPVSPLTFYDFFGGSGLSEEQFADRDDLRADLVQVIEDARQGVRGADAGDVHEGDVAGLDLADDACGDEIGRLGFAEGVEGVERPADGLIARCDDDGLGALIAIAVGEAEEGFRAAPAGLDDLGFGAGTWLRWRRWSVW